MKLCYLVLLSVFVTSATASAQQDQSIMQGSIALNAGYYWIIPFSLTDEATVQGRFSAQGGGGNDIYAYIVDEDGLTNFKNNNDFRFYYQSGKVTVADVSVPLVPGYYYFLFSNKHAVWYSKTVTGIIDVVYEKRSMSIGNSQPDLTRKCFTTAPRNVRLVTLRKDCDSVKCSTNANTAVRQVRKGTAVGVRNGATVRDGRFVWVPIYFEGKDLWIDRRRLEKECFE